LFGIYLVYVQWAQRAAILEFYRADIKLEANQYREALDYYNNGLKRLPNTRGQVRNFEQVWLKKAKAQSQLKDYEAALQTCSIALRHYQSPRLWNCKAVNLYNLKRYDQAIAAYDQAIKIAPDDVWLWNNRGEAYTSLNQPEKAISDFQKAIQLSPAQSFVSWNNLGKLHYELRDYQQAIKAYEEALKVKPEYLPALIGLGNAQKASQLYFQASDSYDRALAINPDYHEAWFGKGSVAEYLGDYTTAKEYYQQASRLKPDWQAASQAVQRINDLLGIY
jgi:tetratricopeptide (TPR) repeat protein